jgi:sortase A
MPRVRHILLVFERALMLVALVALGWFVTSHVMSTLYQRSQEHELERLQQEKKKGADRQLPAPAAPLRTPLSLIGRIEVPRLELSAIVREGVDETTLRRAVGHVPDTALPGASGNVALAGHRDTFFRPLKDVRKGDTVHLTTPEGRFTYVVKDTRIVKPTDVSVLAPTTTPTLTLVTCYPFNYIGSAPDRFIVRAERLEPAPAAIASAVPAPAPRPAMQPAVAKPPAPATKPHLRRVTATKPPAPKKSKNPFRAVLKLFR